jgi:uncharacterized protein
LGLTAVVAVLIGLTAFLPLDWVATFTAAVFLGATWWGALRGSDRDAARRYGLSLGGLLDPEPIQWRRLVSDGARALAWGLGFGCVIFPLYAVGWAWFWQLGADFTPTLPPDFLGLIANQALVIALPEEAFFRGYLQSDLDRRWPPKWNVLGARVGPGILVASLLFALVHLVTMPHPARLAVFFPALLFGWLRARTGGIGASIVLHTLANVFASVLASSYGLRP